MIICLDIGGSTIKGALATAPDRLVPLGRVPTPREDFSTFVSAVAAMVESAGAPAGTPVSISITGVIDPVTGSTTIANVPCASGRPLGADLSRALGVPVLVSNDADCFAVAEAVAGAGRGRRIVFGVILGTGVGGGVVIEGRLLRGAGGLTGEWGHGTIVATRTEAAPHVLEHFACGCGLEGCLDTVGGARGLERLDKLLNANTRDSHAIIEAWQTGEAGAARTIALFIELVSRPLALIVNVLGADIVPVGGGLGNSLELVERLDAAVRTFILRSVEGRLVVPAERGADAGLIGAAAIGFSEHFP